MSDTPARKYRRILLQIDAATHCRETMGAAIDIAVRLDGELQGVFIEDSDLVTLSDLGFVREYRLSSRVAHQMDRDTMETQLRAMARSVQRQFEHAARQRKIAVGFRAVRGTGGTSEERDIDDADLVIIESTGRLHARNFREQLTNRSALTGMLRPTLLLKGAKRLSTEALIICDSLNAAAQGVQAVTTLLSIPHAKITLLPFGLDDNVLASLMEFGKSGKEEGEAGMRLMSPLSVANNPLLGPIITRENLVVMKAGGAFLQDAANLEPLLTSRHPLLFLR